MITLAWMWLAVAQAEEAPEFLLADLDVRIDLPTSTWKMSRWSDWDFKGETRDGQVLIFAWATPMQVALDDPSVWGPVHVRKLEELAAKDAVVRVARLGDVEGRAGVFVDLDFAFGDGSTQGVARGVTTEIEGQNFHMVFVGAKRLAARVDTSRRDVAKRLEFQKPLPAFPEQLTLDASETRVRFPPGWRAPLPTETPLIAPQLARLGLDDVQNCALAIHPVALEDPGVAVTCQGGIWLGVVDAHTFGAVDEVLRDKLFGKAEVEPSPPHDLGDRLGFAWQPIDGLAVGAAPYDQGIARTWVLSKHDPAGALLSILDESDWGGPHPASLGDRARYWLLVRTPAGVGLGIGALVIGLLGFAIRRRMAGAPNPYEIDDDDA